MDDIEFEPYPTELVQIKEIAVALQRKYQMRPATKQLLSQLKQEAEDRYAQIGIRVVVDDADQEFVGSGTETVTMPIIRFLGRIDPTPEFDFARAARETQLGLYDGVPGTLAADGSLVDPRRFL
jgi:hypothetical protein